MKVEPGGETNHDIDPTPLWGMGISMYRDCGAMVASLACLEQPTFIVGSFSRARLMIEPAVIKTLHELAIEDTFGLALWATRFSLRDRWCLSLARDEVRWHSTQPSAQGWRFEGVGIACGHFPFDIEPLQITEFYFDPTQRRRASFKRYVHERVEEELEKYCTRIESDALAAGLKRTPRKQVIKHFDWLARYQVRGESFASIAKHSDFHLAGGRQTIRKAVIDLADYLSLRLRPSIFRETRR